MTSVTAQYTSPTHSLNITHSVNSSETSQKASLEALRQAVLSTQTDLNVFLTKRKLEEDRANGMNGTSSKRKARENEDEENLEENGGEDEMEE
jgi:hypothetical protein